MKITGMDTGFTQNALKKPKNEDNFSKGIQSRIDDLQKQLQQLSENEEMDPKEKLKKKQEIDKQIAELNEQLNQRKQEKEQEKLEKAKTAPEKKYDRFERSGYSESMSSIISASVSIGQAETRGNAARALEGKVNVLKSEIKQDGGGVSTEKKQAAVAELSAKANNAVSAQADELNKALNKLAQGGAEEKTESKDEKEKAEETSGKKNVTNAKQDEKDEKDGIVSANNSDNSNDVEANTNSSSVSINNEK